MTMARDREHHGPSGSTRPVPTHPGQGSPGPQTDVRADVLQASARTAVRAAGQSAVAAPPDRGGWLYRRREAKAQKRAEAGRQRVVHRVEMLGPQWRIVDYNLDDPDFLAVGPGGVFQVTVCDHGRSRVQVAGDVVQVNGQRPPYVALARRDAQRISDQMSRVARRRIPVIPVVAFLGTGPIVYYGQPPAGCVVTTYHDLARALGAHGSRVGLPTIEKLVAVARRVDSATVGQYMHVSV
jgi:hypothetical protein